MRPPRLAHQQAAHEKLSTLKFAALFADMGTGKTRIAIDWVLHKRERDGVSHALVIAPSVVAAQWVTEQLPLHCNVHYNAHAYQAKTTKKYLATLDRFMLSAKYSKALSFLCVNFETFATDKGLTLVAQFLSKCASPPALIVDESSRIKNPDAISVKNIVKLRTLYPNSYRLIMSGTPASKSPVDLWSQFDFLTTNYFRSGYVAFKNTYTVRCHKKLTLKGRLVSIETTIDKYTYDKIKRVIAQNTKNGKMHPDVPELIQQRFAISAADFWFVYNSPIFQRFKHMDKLQQHIAPVTYAVKRSDCIDLPPKIYQTIQCPLNTQQKKLIKELVAYSATVYAGEMLTVNVKALIGLRILQICGGHFSHLTDIEGVYDTVPIKGANSKINYLLGDIPEIGNQQFIICAVYSAEIEDIINKVGKVADVAALYGKTTTKDRAYAVEAFKAGDLQGLIMNPSVGGYGLNLQASSVQYWYSRNYRTEARLQTEDRQHRIGTTISPVYKDLVSDISFEQQVLDVLKEGKDINEVFVNKTINEVFEV